MRRRTPQRAMAIALIFSAISFWNFSRLKGSECIRAIHIVTLLTCGLLLGVFLNNLVLWLRNRP